MKRKCVTQILTPVWRMLLAALAVSLLAGCSQPTAADQPAPAPTRAVVDMESLTPVDGQQLYVPAYSEIYYADSERTWDFAITLAIHNTDAANPIVIEGIQYYNGRGEFVADYSQEPFLLPPLATHAVTVPRDDKSGGVGANFIVEWVAESPAIDPVVEAVMISAAGQQGLSFITESRVIAEWGE